MGSEDTGSPDTSTPTGSYICAICSDTIQTCPGKEEEVKEAGAGSSGNGGSGSASSGPGWASAFVRMTSRVPSGLQTAGLSLTVPMRERFGDIELPVTRVVLEDALLSYPGRNFANQFQRNRYPQCIVPSPPKPNNSTTNGPKASNLVAVPCGHVFHSYCLNKWLASELPSSNQCPNCRKLVTKSACLYLYPDSYEEPPPPLSAKDKDSTPSTSSSDLSPSPKPTTTPSNTKSTSPNSKPKIVIKLEVENKALRSKLQSVEADFRIQQTLYELQRQDFHTRQKDLTVRIKTKEDELEKVKEELQNTRLNLSKEVEKFKKDLETASNQLQAEKMSKSNLESNLSTFLRQRMDEAEKAYIDLATARNGIGTERGTWYQQSSPGSFSSAPDVLPLPSPVPIITPRFAPVGTGPMPIPPSSYYLPTRQCGRYTKSLSSLGIGGHSNNRGGTSSSTNASVIVAPNKPRPPRNNHGKKMVYEKTLSLDDDEEEDADKEDIDIIVESLTCSSSSDEENLDIMSAGPDTRKRKIVGSFRSSMIPKKNFLPTPNLSLSDAGKGKHSKSKLRKLNTTSNPTVPITIPASDFALSMSPITISSDSESEPDVVGTSVTDFPIVQPRRLQVQDSANGQGGSSADSSNLENSSSSCSSSRIAEAGSGSSADEIENPMETETSE